MKTLVGLEIPIRSSHPTQLPEVNSVLIYSVQGVVYQINSAGQISPITNADSASGVVGDVPVFIQATQPVDSDKYIWIQTNVNGNPMDFQVWFEDGLV